MSEFGGLWKHWNTLACIVGWVARLCRSWLSQGGKKHPNFPLEKSHWDKTVGKSQSKIKKKRLGSACLSLICIHALKSLRRLKTPRLPLDKGGPCRWWHGNIHGYSLRFNSCSSGMMRMMIVVTPSGGRRNNPGNFQLLPFYVALASAAISITSLRLYRKS